MTARVFAPARPGPVRGSVRPSHVPTVPFIRKQER